MVRRTLARTLLVLAGVAVALLLAEGALRVAGVELPARGRLREGRLTRPVTPDEVPGVGQLLRPGLVAKSVYPGGAGEADRVVVYAINSLGFRDHPFARRKQPGTFRIAVLGDSFTFGTGVAMVQTFPRVLGRVLERLRPDLPIEVLNCGVFNYNAGQEVALLEHSVLALEPDLVLICAYLNDSSGMDRTFEQGEELALDLEGARWEVRWMLSLGLTSARWDARTLASAGPLATPAVRRMTRLRGVSRLADLLAHKAYHFLHGRQTEANYLASWEEGRRGYEFVSTALDDAVALCSERGIALHATMFPDLTCLDPFPFGAAHAAYARLCAERAIPYHDLLPVFEGRNGRALWAHAHDHHPNPEAHALAGRALAEALVDYLPR